jgi:hypothetical protein
MQKKKKKKKKKRDSSGLFVAGRYRRLESYRDATARR